VVGSAAVWAALLAAATAPGRRLRRVAGAAFVVLFALPAGVQPATYALHHVYASLDSIDHVSSVPWLTVGALPLRPLVAFHLGAGVLAAVAILALARRAGPPRRVSGWRGALLFVPALLVVLVAGDLPVSYEGHQSTSPDLIYYHGVSFVWHERVRRALLHDARLVRVQRRTPPALPALHAAPARPRNVLVVLQEALRADVTCSAYDPVCTEANVETNDLLPERIGFRRMRANASSTLISFATLFGGLDPTETSERLHAAPLLWEYAHAAGYDAAFWTGQHPMFGNYRLFFQDLPLSRGCSGAELDPLADILAGPSDDLLSERVIADWDALREPFFAVVQYSNLHFPRVFDPERAPFQPTDPFEREEPWKNYYRNVAYLSDLAVARLLRHVRASPSGARTVIVYTADHGEALLEHENENFHASTVYEEELRVPAWVDAPPGTLSAAEEASLRGHGEDAVFHLDVAPTLLDLLGLWDEPAVAPFRAAMPGRPLTRPERPSGPVPLTNVSWVWEYWLPNWGMMDWPLKVVAESNDVRYRCLDLARDPEEWHDLGEAACGPLAVAARARFGVMPGEMDQHLRDAPGWGRGPGR
jgi:glucan phosphoethanolaminetransferase (alkaline phosphatase superfamily)